MRTDRTPWRYFSIFAVLISAAIFCAAPCSNAASDGGSSEARADWERVPAAGANSDNGQVLQIPRVINPNAMATDGAKKQKQNSSASSGNGSSGTASTSNDSSWDELGTIQDYGNQQKLSGGSIMIPIPAGAVSGSPMPMGPPPFVARPALITPPANIGGMLPVRPVTVRPGSLTGMPSTSPMLMPPRGTSAMPSIW